MNKNISDYSHVFIDCGGHKAESVKKARQMFGPDILIVTFEPNSDLHAAYDIDECKNNFILMPYGVSTENGTINFFENTGGTQCFTAVKEMVQNTKDVKNVKSVDCIDICAWIKDNVHEKQRVTLKLDVEGLEYNILPKMLATGIMPLIDEIFMDFHAHRMFKDVRNFIAKDYEEMLRIAVDCEHHNLSMLSMHNGLIFELFGVTKSIFHWDALIDAGTQQPTHCLKPVYYLAYRQDHGFAKIPLPNLHYT